MHINVYLHVRFSTLLKVLPRHLHVKKYFITCWNLSQLLNFLAALWQIWGSGYISLLSSVAGKWGKQTYIHSSSRYLRCWKEDGNSQDKNREHDLGHVQGYTEVPDGWCRLCMRHQAMHPLIRLERKPEQVQRSLHSCTVSILPKEEVKVLTKQLCEGEVKICVCIGYIHMHTHARHYWCKNSKGNPVTVISLQLALQPWKLKCSSNIGLLVRFFMTSFVI